MSNDGGYLTMARIMAKELKKYQRKNLPSNATGWQIVNTKSVFEAGFMAGFEAKYFKEEEVNG